MIPTPDVNSTPEAEHAFKAAVSETTNKNETDLTQAKADIKTLQETVDRLQSSIEGDPIVETVEFNGGLVLSDFIGDAVKADVTAVCETTTTGSDTVGLILYTGTLSADDYATVASNVFTYPAAGTAKYTATGTVTNEVLADGTITADFSGSHDDTITKWIVTRYRKKS